VDNRRRMSLNSVVLDLFVHHETRSDMDERKSRRLFSLGEYRIYRNEHISMKYNSYRCSFFILIILIFLFLFFIFLVYADHRMFKGRFTCSVMVVNCALGHVDINIIMVFIHNYL